MTGYEAARRWLAAMELEPVDRWHVEATLTGDDAWFRLAIYSDEWGFALHHGKRVSWIRVRETAFVHGRDDFALLVRTPDLAHVDALIAELAQRHALGRITVRSNVEHAKERVRTWLERLNP